MDIDYRGITMEVSSIPAVTLQQATPSPRYYRKSHRQNRWIPAVPITVQGSNSSQSHHQVHHFEPIPILD